VDRLWPDLHDGASRWKDGYQDVLHSRTTLPTVAAPTGAHVTNAHGFTIALSVTIAIIVAVAVAIAIAVAVAIVVAVAVAIVVAVAVAVAGGLRPHANVLHQRLRELRTLSD
jgi:hypothetical protein